MNVTVVFMALQQQWRFEGDPYPTIQELIIAQHKSGQPVTKKSEAILQRPIMREKWELNNDDVDLGMKIGDVSVMVDQRNCDILWF